MTLRILLADDHAIVRRGVAQLLLERGIASDVLEAETGAQAISLAGQCQVDVTLLDISLPDINGVDVLKRLKRQTPRMPVLMFSMYREDQYAVRALKAGAAGYLSKTADPVQMIGAIQQVAAGRKYVSPEMAEALATYVSLDTERLPARTAYLHVNYRSVTPLGRALHAEARLDRLDGRKRFLSASLRDGELICADAEGLFVELRPGQA